MSIIFLELNYFLYFLGEYIYKHSMSLSGFVGKEKLMVQWILSPEGYGDLGKSRRRRTISTIHGPLLKVRWRVMNPNVFICRLPKYSSLDVYDSDFA